MAANETKKDLVRVAVTQLEPEWLDLQGTVAKTCRYIAEAARNGAQIIAFPEVFIPGYPTWIWSRPVDPDLSVKYIRNSLRINSPEMKSIQDCARDNGIIVCLGFSENDNHSLYISQSLINAEGEIVYTRRKVKPTHVERTTFGDGNGDSLKNVADTHIGRVGSLACWEHLQPLLKFNTFSQREEFHIAAWPAIFPHTGSELWSLSEEGCRTMAQTYAMESQTFVLHTTTVLTQKGIDLMQGGPLLFGSPGGGNSAVFGPDGRKLTEDLPPLEEGLLYADLDKSMIMASRCFADACGHYSRPDLLSLTINNKVKMVVNSLGSE
ncbi:hypothetical protein BDW71DRAFT_212351 [Aspergillus fruticulosus]